MTFLGSSRSHPHLRANITLEPSDVQDCEVRSTTSGGLYLYQGIILVLLIGGTVDGRNPAPPGMYKTLKIPSNGRNYLSTGAGF